MTEVIEVQAELIEPTKDIAVSYSPALIQDNLASIEAYIDKQLEPYIGTVLDPNDDKQVTAGRNCMSDLNKMKKPIEGEVKRLKREYEAPFNDFMSRVKTITDKIENARADIKAQVDAADEAFRQERYAVLLEDYQGCAGIVADLISFDAFIEKEWLRRTTKEYKAINELEEKVASVFESYETLNNRELVHKDEVMRHFCKTLDVMGALKLEDQLIEKDRQMAEFKAKAEAIAAVKEQRTEPVKKPAQAASEPRFRYVLTLEFEGTRFLAQKLAQAIKSLGITGGNIECKGKVENDGI